MHKADPDRVAELALQHALGLLEPEDREELERLLLEEPSVGELTATYADVASLLAWTSRMESPPPSAKQRLIQRLSTPSPAPASGGFTSMRADEGSWTPLPFPGVSARRLHLDIERGVVTTLIRMAPGAHYPRHRHVGVEECYVLEGEVRVGQDLVFRTGDYQRAGSGSIHDVQWTEAGCLLLIIASTMDELIS